MKDEIKAQVIIGNDAEEFVDSELGRTVLGMAKQDVEAAVIAFAAADASNLSRIQELQLQVRLGQKFEQYLVELIQRGREALAPKE